jgi:hypothetical protein
MVDWSAAELNIIQQFKGKRYETFLKEIPVNERRWKCHTCFTILNNSDLIEGKCPICGEIHIQQMCPIDHNGCGHTISEGIEYCPVCGKNICPQCGDHSVVSVSRVTGYLSDISGWNNAKKQELKDRVRYNPLPITT